MPKPKRNLNATYISERLQESLRPISRCAMTTVVAPMGYGKTTAVNWYLAERAGWVIEAAKKAHCHEFIEKLPQGYQTVISEGGASLSGGERQRVAIARAILKDSPIILLDEALSSLDAENAVAIQKGIEEMIKGKTVFLVSHTLSYIQNSDQILVLSDGILQGCGKHEELLQTVPLYQTMWEKEKSIKNWKLA